MVRRGGPFGVTGFDCPRIFETGSVRPSSRKTAYLVYCNPPGVCNRVLCCLRASFKVVCGKQECTVLTWPWALLVHYDSLCRTPCLLLPFLSRTTIPGSLSRCLSTPPPASSLPSGSGSDLSPVRSVPHTYLYRRPVDVTRSVSRVPSRTEVVKTLLFVQCR